MLEIDQEMNRCDLSLCRSHSIDGVYHMHCSYKQQLHHANNEILELNNQLQETVALRDSETRQLKIKLANTESAMQTLHQEIQTNATQMASQVA